MESFVQDVRHAVRGLARRKGFAAVVVSTFALGIGATTAIFSVLNHVLLRPLPYRDTQELVQVWETRRDLNELAFSFPNLESLQSGTNSFAGIAGWMFGDVPSVTLTGEESPERIPGAIITANLFSVLGIEPTIGRGFLPEENEPGSANVVVLSHELWQKRFGGETNIIGRVLQMNGVGHTVAGIMPPEFQFPAASNAQVWRPISIFQSWRQNRGNHLPRVVARLKRGVSLDVAATEVANLGNRLAVDFPETNRDQGMRLVPLHEQVVGNVRVPFYVLMSAVLLLSSEPTICGTNPLTANSKWPLHPPAARAFRGWGSATD